MSSRFVVAVGSSIIALASSVFGQSTPSDDPIQLLVGRLELGGYKATIKGLTQFGDRQQGTDRNRAAVDWIEAQLRSYGCTNTQRIRYVYAAPPPQQQPQQSGGTPRGSAIASGDVRAGAGGSRLRGMTRLIPPNNNPDA